MWLWFTRQCSAHSPSRLSHCLDLLGIQRLWYQNTSYKEDDLSISDLLLPDFGKGKFLTWHLKLKISSLLPIFNFCFGIRNMLDLLAPHCSLPKTLMWSPLRYLNLLVTKIFWHSFHLNMNAMTLDIFHMETFNETVTFVFVIALDHLRLSD